MKASTVNQVSSRSSVVADLVELTRLRLNLLVVLTTGIGFLLAVEGPFPLALFLHTVIGTALVAAGSSALNQVLEREVDATMPRTANRPIPTGRMDPDVALAVGVLLSVGGLGQLAWFVNLETAFLGALTLAGYLFVYTPLKRKTSLATIVGAVPGAIPPMMGWAALRGEISIEAWALFGILFLWQLPHFLAIAWLYRGDYELGGMPMLPVVDREGRVTARQAILYASALVPVSLLPTALGMTGFTYLCCALVLGAVYVGYGVSFSRHRNHRAALQLMLASVIYLPALLASMVLDRLFGG